LKKDDNGDILEFSLYNGAIFYKGVAPQFFVCYIQDIFLLLLSLGFQDSENHKGKSQNNSQ